MGKTVSKKVEKAYVYKKPAENGKKAPLIVCYANNPAHAMQVFRNRLDGEFIDKNLIEEYVIEDKPKKAKAKK